MQRVILRLKPDYQETWNTIQRSQSEDLPFKYLKRLLPGAKVLKNVYYRGKTDSGATEWCEADGLLIYDAHLFVIEARGGAFTYTPPSSDFPAYIISLKNLVLKPAMQGRRFLDYLKTAESVPLFDSNHSQIDKLRKSDFRHITICPVTLDPFTELAAQIQHLRKIGVDVGASPVWAISLDDLRVYADIFENPLVFLHYIEQRMQAFDSDVIQCNDELDHLGLYLDHNHYSTHAKGVQGDSDAPIDFIGYRSKVDKFFHERMFDSNAPCSLKQGIPARLQKIIEVLSQNNKPGRAAVVAYILDIGGDWRTKIDTDIIEELTRQPTTKRPKPFSTHGNVKLTIYCWTEHSGPRKAAWGLDHAQTLVVMHSESRRLLMELSYSATGELQEVDWKWVGLANIPPDQLPRLRLKTKGLRQKRLSNAITESRKIRRNEFCPCGSGKKYKRCCWDR
ncbi:MAG: SEC-C metal-binding domain-containing protein [Nitrospira sp.]|nr:SEC-C metal-binding domain-containing protein [Nitrospira sp.]